MEMPVEKPCKGPCRKKDGGLGLFPQGCPDLCPPLFYFYDRTFRVFSLLGYKLHRDRGTPSNPSPEALASPRLVLNLLAKFRWHVSAMAQSGLY